MSSAEPVGYPRATIGTAVLAAGVVLATPIGAAPPVLEASVVGLAASPLDPYVDLVTNTFDNLGAIGSAWLEDPLPAAVQLITNWFEYGQFTVNALVDTGRSFVNGLINLPEQLQVLFSAISEGDFEKFFAQLIIVVLGTFPIPGLIDRLLTVPYEIVGNFVSASLAALHALQVPVGLAGLTWVGATFVEWGSVTKDFFSDLLAGDFSGALGQLVEAPALVLNAALNSDAPGLAGLLTPFADLHQSGLVDAVVNYLPQTVAAGLDAGLGDVPDFGDAIG